MNTQTLIALGVVLVCAVVVMRSWIAFWIGLIRSTASGKTTSSGCQGCSHGCQKTSSAPRIVELKREPLDYEKSQ